MAPIVGRVRAYFAPVSRATEQPTLFDAAQSGAFALNAPPAPWLDLGWIAGFARTCGTKVTAVRGGCSGNGADANADGNRCDRCVRVRELGEVTASAFGWNATDEFTRGS